MKTHYQTQSHWAGLIQGRTVAGLLAGIASAALLSATPARADGGIAISFGLPHAQVTIAKTWDDGDQPQIVTEETTAPIEYASPSCDAVNPRVLVVDHPYRMLRIVHGRRVWVIERRPERRIEMRRGGFDRHGEYSRRYRDEYHDNSRQGGHRRRGDDREIKGNGGYRGDHRNRDGYDSENHDGRSYGRNTGRQNPFHAPHGRSAPQRGVQH